MKIYRLLIFSILILSQPALTQVALSFQGNETGDTWGFTTTGASANALTQANNTANYVSGTKSIVVGGNTGGGSCYQGGSGNGSTIENKITFSSINISSSNSFVRTLTFSWGSRFPTCEGTGWDAGEDLTFTPVLDGIAQAPITVAVGNNNTNFSIRGAAQKYTYSIPSCINSFAFELMLPTNRRDELLFVDDVKLSTPALNSVQPIALTVTGDTSVCIGNTSSVFANSIPGVNYEWSGLPVGANFTTPNNTTNSNTMTINWGTVSSGIYQVKVKPWTMICGTNQYGTEVIFQVTVKESPVLTTSPSSVICLGSNITIIASGAETYSWNNGLGTNNSITVSPITTTSYQVTGYNGSCSATETIVITVNQSAISAGNDILICEGNSVTLMASGGNTYTWSHGVVNGVPFTPTSTNTYTVTSTGTCAGSDDVLVTVENAPTPNFDADVYTGCMPLQVQFENQTSGNNTYQWNFGDGTSSAIDAPTHTFSSAGCMDITLLVTSLNGCSTTHILDNFICISDKPNVQFTSDTQEINSDQSTVEFTNFTTNATDYLWDFGDGNQSTEFSTAHTFDPFSLENQLVTLTATNENGCIDSISTIIYFTSAPSIYVPNAFTPDGNEFNQIFIPKFGPGIDPTKYNLMIFNRWGELIFETFDINLGWDGTYKGTPVAIGEYIWKIRYGIVDGIDQIEKVGHVSKLL